MPALLEVLLDCLPGVIIPSRIVRMRVTMSYTGPKALPSPARRPVLVRRGDEVGRTPASEFLFSTGKLRAITGWISTGGFLIHDSPVYRCLCPLIPRPRDLVQGVAMSTTASMPIRFFAQMPLFFVYLSSFRLLQIQE